MAEASWLPGLGAVHRRGGAALREQGRTSARPSTTDLDLSLAMPEAVLGRAAGPLAALLGWGAAHGVNAPLPLCWPALSMNDDTWEKRPTFFEAVRDFLLFLERGKIKVSMKFTYLLNS